MMYFRSYVLLDHHRAARLQALCQVLCNTESVSTASVLMGPRSTANVLMGRRSAANVLMGHRSAANVLMGHRSAASV